MTRWIALQPGWKLQDVQAGLNVVIAFLCAGGIFVLVRYCWLIAARRVARNRDVPAHSLLSLNTIGETIDVIWLLRYDLLRKRYHGLLLQVVFVMLLTVATLMSGFIARFSTRNGEVLREIKVNGTVAARNTQSIVYAEAETNITMTKLVEAGFPQDRLLEYLPDTGVRWEYEEGQWNSSWSMACDYEPVTPFGDLEVSDNCTNGIWSQIPATTDNWVAFHDNIENASWDYEQIGWRNNGSVYRDWLIFAHGVMYTDWDSAAPGENGDFITGMTVQTVAYHLTGINASIPDGCSMGPGKMATASYTSMRCKLTRAKGSKPEAELRVYGANPDGYDTSWQADAYMQHYGNRFRQESIKEMDITVVEGPELAMFYQAYMITKDASSGTYAERVMSAHVRVAQISLTCLIGCVIAAGVVLFGLINYWFFLFRHWSRLDQTPQSKLDWMLQTLRKENGDYMQPETKEVMRQRLSQAMAGGTSAGEVVPLAVVNSGTKGADIGDRRSVKSTASSQFTNVGALTPGSSGPGDDGFETPILGANFSGRAPTSTWFPQQYERVSPHVSQETWGYMGRSRDSDYNPVQQQSPYTYAGTHHIDTAYDPGRG